MSSEELDTLNAIQNQRPHAPFRKLEFAPVNIALTARKDGAQLLINRQPLAPPPVQQIGVYLRLHARNRPEQVFLAEPAADEGNWHTLSYAQALDKVNALSQWLLNQSLPAEQPVFILSENSINQALLQFAAMQVGIPVMPLSAAYSLMSKTCGKIADLTQRFVPALIYAEEGERFKRLFRSRKSTRPTPKYCAIAPAQLPMPHN